MPLFMPLCTENNLRFFSARGSQILSYGVFKYDIHIEGEGMDAKKQFKVTDIWKIICHWKWSAKYCMYIKCRVSNPHGAGKCI